jgi:dTDP-4-dehydrorhamnose reductase
MNKPVIVIFGSAGQVGWELRRSLAPLGSVIALDRHSPDYCGDLSRLEDIRSSVLALTPALIVNAAAYTAVDKAEQEPEQAFLINAAAVGVLAEASRQVGAALIHYSTDYVFPGDGERPWQEDDVTGPLSVYGQTKLEGERAIAQSGCDAAIFRTSWVYAARGQNFVRTMLRLGKERESLSIVADQVGAPTGAELISDVTAHAARHILATGNGRSVYHLAPTGTVSWHDYADYIFGETRRLLGADALKVQQLSPVPTSSYPTPAKRPLNSRLSLTKLQETFDIVLPPWHVGVDRVLRELLT